MMRFSILCLLYISSTTTRTTTTTSAFGLQSWSVGKFHHHPLSSSTSGISSSRTRTTTRQRTLQWATRGDETDTSSSSSSSSDEQLSLDGKQDSSSTNNSKKKNLHISGSSSTRNTTATVTDATTTSPSPSTSMGATKKEAKTATVNDDDNNDESKKIRVAKAQAEIDRILSCPIDPPFDMENELKKVISISPPLVTEGTPEYELEYEINQMEEDLYQAVKQQDYIRAQQQQERISQRHVDDCGAVLQVNSAFYKAFSDKNVNEMKRLWLQDNTAVCIHPSYTPLLGYNTVMESWNRMFTSSDGSFQRNWMEPTNIRLTVRGATAIITCEEQVYARRFIRGKKRQTELINQLLATNIFRKINGKWYLTYHHASWHADSEAAKIALQRGGMTSTNNKSSGGRGSGDDDDGIRPTRIVIRGGRGYNQDPSSSNKNNMKDDGPSPLDGILGVNNFGPLLGGSDDNEDSDGKGGGIGPGGGGPVKRVFMGSLSDILNGGLGDLLDVTGGSTSPGSGSTGDGNNIDNGKSDAVIQFSSIDGSDDDDDDDDDDLLIDGEEDDDDDEDEGAEMFNFLSRSIPTNGEKISSASSSSSKTRRGEKFSSKTNGKSSSTTSSTTAAHGSNLRQSCIATLRKLASRGSISAKQKRILLTDIIHCSAKGESSMVEVAYELLCYTDSSSRIDSSSSSSSEEQQQENGIDNDTMEEEFADQCRVVASSLPDSTSLV